MKNIIEYIKEHENRILSELDCLIDIGILNPKLIPDIEDIYKFARFYIDLRVELEKNEALSIYLNRHDLPQA